MDIENAQLARRNGKYKKATELYKLAVNEDPGNAQALAGLALTHIYLKENDAAAARASEAIRLDPNQSLAHIALAFVYHANGQVEQYKEEIEKAFALQPFFYEVACAYAKMLLDDKKIDDALPIFEKIIEANPRKVCPHQLLGLVYTQKKRHNDAFKEYFKAFQVQPSIDTVLALLGGLINIYPPWTVFLWIVIQVTLIISALVSKFAIIFLALILGPWYLAIGIQRIRNGQIKSGVAIFGIVIMYAIFYYLNYASLK